MNQMKTLCNVCSGMGYTTMWNFVPDDIQTEVGRTTGRLENEEIVCETCNGKGYIEHAVFSVKEAEAILKYCGLDKE